MTERVIAPPSFWLDDVAGPLVPRPPLEGSQDADIVIVGAGYTGLWTAYYLSQLRPDLDIAIVEGEIAGFGAAGRNGGWCTTHLTGIATWMGGRRREQAVALQRAMFDAVDEVGRVARKESIACDFAKGGFLNFTTNDHEVSRSREILEGVRQFGFDEADYRWLDAEETNAKVRIQGCRGSIYSPHGAAVQPAKLARGLAECVERRGVRIYEESPVRAVEPGAVVTDRGRLRAGIVLVCTEGYTKHLKDVRRKLMPMHSMMIATQPLSASLWEEIGAADRVVFGDSRRILSYAQRTAEGRLALGAGGRYVYGSRALRYLPPQGSDYALAEQVMEEFFPCLRGVEITHRWGGAFGVSRDWRPFVRFERGSGLGAAGGYAGNGVAAANLAGQTLAELVVGQESERRLHPWVQHESPSWEPEPLRWLAVTSMLRLGRAADLDEIRGRNSPLRSFIFDRFAGH